MRVGGDWITNSATQAVLLMLENAGFEAYFVGGCVRNALLGAPVGDIDIATNARPETVMELAKNTGLNAIPTGIDHGTVTVVSGRIPHEITTYRDDIETDGRHAIVRFSDTLHEDAKRRDFTMNALYADARGDVVDPCGGVPDLERRLFRFIGCAETRIKEDYLRILRFFRFVAWYGDPKLGFDAEALAAISANSAGLETISRERIGTEFKKLLLAPHPEMAIATMRQTNVLPYVLEGADDRWLALLIHFEELYDLAPDMCRRLAILGGTETKNALRLSNAEAKTYDRLREEIGSSRSIAELAYRFGANIAWDVAMVRAAMFETPPAFDTKDQIARGAAAMFPISAKDLMPEYAGAALGARLRALETHWIASGFAVTARELLELP